MNIISIFVVALTSVALLLFVVAMVKHFKSIATEQADKKIVLTDTQMDLITAQVSDRIIRAITADKKRKSRTQLESSLLRDHTKNIAFKINNVIPIANTKEYYLNDRNQY